jgi:hypothetical protein
MLVAEEVEVVMIAVTLLLVLQADKVVEVLEQQIALSVLLLVKQIKVVAEEVEV